MIPLIVLSVFIPVAFVLGAIYGFSVGYKWRNLDGQIYGERN